MKSVQVIPYTDTCNYLGNTICSNDENVTIGNHIFSHDENVTLGNISTDMNRRLINETAEFSRCDIMTISSIFKTYCMNIWMSSMEI